MDTEADEYVMPNLAGNVGPQASSTVVFIPFLLGYGTTASFCLNYLNDT